MGTRSGNTEAQRSVTSNAATGSEAARFLKAVIDDLALPR